MYSIFQISSIVTEHEAEVPTIARAATKPA